MKRYCPHCGRRVRLAMVGNVEVIMCPRCKALWPPINFHRLPASKPKRREVTRA